MSAVRPKPCGCMPQLANRGIRVVAGLIPTISAFGPRSLAVAEYVKNSHLRKMRSFANIRTASAIAKVCGARRKTFASLCRECYNKAMAECKVKVKMDIVLSGIRPTGNLHLGNYFRGRCATL